MKKLVHPNVVRLLEVIDDPQNDLLFMVSQNGFDDDRQAVGVDIVVTGIGAFALGRSLALGTSNCTVPMEYLWIRIHRYWQERTWCTMRFPSNRVFGYIPNRNWLGYQASSGLIIERAWV